jgi:hypothetical protein
MSNCDISGTTISSNIVIQRGVYVIRAFPSHAFTVTEEPAYSSKGHARETFTAAWDNTDR